MEDARARDGYVGLGFGVGALLDGIVLHQVLQWHHLLSSRVATSTLSGLERNTVADGLFHLAGVVVLLAAWALLTKRRVDPRGLVGLGLVGWGAFNVLDHVVFHLALRAHHIREDVGDPAAYDWAFFALGLALIAIGSLVWMRRPREARRDGARDRRSVA